MRPSLLVICLVLAQQIHSQPLPIHLYFASHNETTDQQFHGLNYNSPADYSLMRAHVRRVCDTLLAHGAPYDMMLESNFILGCLKNENAASNPDDLIEWASRQPGFSVQPHNHFKPFGVGANPYNYADLVYLLDSCGVDTAYVMGGFIWRNFTNPVMVNEDWTAWQTPQPGFTFPAARWRPTLLWGGGSPNHIDDFDAYGIWKPQDATSTGFGQHDPDKPLVNFGGGCSEEFVLWDTTDATLLAYRIINFADSARFHFSNDPDAFFNMKVMMNFRHFPSAGYAEKLGLVLRLIEPYIAAGKIQYSGILDTWAAWQALHPDPDNYFALRCEDAVKISNATPNGLSTATSEPELRQLVYPNPASERVYFPETMSDVVVYDFSGSMKIRQNGKDGQISVAQLEPGLYLIQGATWRAKLVVQR